RARLVAVLPAPTRKRRSGLRFHRCRRSPPAVRQAWGSATDPVHAGGGGQTAGDVPAALGAWRACPWANSWIGIGLVRGGWVVLRGGVSGQPLLYIVQMFDIISQVLRRTPAARPAPCYALRDRPVEMARGGSECPWLRARVSQDQGPPAGREDRIGGKRG